MKTTQIMERKLDGMPVQQRTSDGYFNATELLRQWNERVEDDNCQFSNIPQKDIFKHRDLRKYFEFSQTNQFLDAVSKEENIDEVVKVTRGKNGSTWMHPLVFIDFAMWLNPKFKYQVLKFVRDELIAYRNILGDKLNAFKEVLAKKGIESEPLDWMKFASAFKKWTLGKGNKEINRSTLSEIVAGCDGYTELSVLVSVGILNSMDDVIRHVAGKNHQNILQPIRDEARVG